MDRDHVFYPTVNKTTTWHWRTLMCCAKSSYEMHHENLSLMFWLGTWTFNRIVFCFSANDEHMCARQTLLYSWKRGLVTSRIYSSISAEINFQFASLLFCTKMARSALKSEISSLMEIFLFSFSIFVSFLHSRLQSELWSHKFRFDCSIRCSATAILRPNVIFSANVPQRIVQQILQESCELFRRKVCSRVSYQAGSFLCHFGDIESPKIQIRSLSISFLSQLMMQVIRASKLLFVTLDGDKEHILLPLIVTSMQRYL